MKIGPTARLLSVVAALFLGVTGAQEWSVQSKNAITWADETSFAALALRAQGKLKIGLAISWLALASTGVKSEEEEPFQEQPSQGKSIVDAFLAGPKMPPDSDD